MTGIDVLDLTPGSEHCHALIRAVLSPNDHSARRVETVDLTSFADARMRVSLDVDLSNDSIIQLGDGGPYLVPLMVTTKRVLRHFDLRDANGMALPVLTRAEGNTLVKAILHHAGDQTLGPMYERHLKQRIDDAVDCKRDDAERFIMRLNIIASTFVDTEAEPLNAFKRIELKVLLAYAAHFARNFAMFALVPSSGYEPGRTILKFAYDSGLTNLSERRGVIGWVQDVDAIADQNSYHLEVHAPPGMRVAELEFRTEHLFADGAARRTDEALPAHVAHINASRDEEIISASARVQMKLESSAVTVASYWGAWASFVLQAVLFLYVLWTTNNMAAASAGGAQALTILLAAGIWMIGTVAGRPPSEVAALALRSHRVVAMHSSVSMLVSGLAAGLIAGTQAANVVIGAMVIVQIAVLGYASLLRPETDTGSLAAAILAGPRARGGGDRA